MPTTTKVTKPAVDTGLKLADVKHSQALVAGPGQKCEPDKPVCCVEGQVYITGAKDDDIFIACANGLHQVHADEAGNVIGFTRAPLE